MEREQSERKDSESSVNALKRQLASIKENCSKLDAEIEQAKASITTLRKGLTSPIPPKLTVIDSFLRAQKRSQHSGKA